MAPPLDRVGASAISADARILADPRSGSREAAPSVAESGETADQLGGDEVADRATSRKSPVSAPKRISFCADDLGSGEMAWWPRRFPTF
jgi:hypothetical protein